LAVRVARLTVLPAVVDIIAVAQAIAIIVNPIAAVFGARQHRPRHSVQTPSTQICCPDLHGPTPSVEAAPA
jgi:hypothetical protein